MMAMLEMIESKVYVITARGALEPCWADRLRMTVTVHRTGDRPVTVLTGELVDQAALQGILMAVYDLGLPVVAIASA